MNILYIIQYELVPQMIELPKFYPQFASTVEIIKNHFNTIHKSGELLNSY